MSSLGERTDALAVFPQPFTLDHGRNRCRLCIRCQQYGTNKIQFDVTHVAYAEAVTDLDVHAVTFELANIDVGCRDKAIGYDVEASVDASWSSTFCSDLRQSACYEESSIFS